jgi:hypothetical protein
VWSSSREDLQGLSSKQEEADTRIVLHARDAKLRGYKQVNILCRDTDVLVLLLAHRQDLCDDIWMFSGTSRRKKSFQSIRSCYPKQSGSRYLHSMPSQGVIPPVSFRGLASQQPGKHLRVAHQICFKILAKKVPQVHPQFPMQRLLSVSSTTMAHG